MRYRVTTLLLAMTVTAFAIAAIPWLRKHDSFMTGALIGSWTTAGFVIGWLSGRVQLSNGACWPLAAIGICANGLLWYWCRFSIDFLQSPDSALAGLPVLVLYIVKANDHYLLLGMLLAFSIGMIAFASLRMQSSLAVCVGLSLLAWFVVGWIGFIGVSAASTVS